MDVKLKNVKNAPLKRQTCIPKIILEDGRHVEKKTIFAQKQKNGRSSKKKNVPPRWRLSDADLRA